MESVALTNLALLQHQIGDQETAVEYAHQALQVIQDVNSPLFRSYALTWLAHALSCRCA